MNKKQQRAADWNSDDENVSFYTFARNFIERGPHHSNEENGLEEPETLASLAVSVMFAIALFRQSLTAMMEVIFLLADEELDLCLSRHARAFVKHFFGSHNSKDQQDAWEMHAFLDIDAFIYSCVEANQSCLDSVVSEGELRAREGSPHLSHPFATGQLQALAIMRCLGNVVDGSYFASDGGHVLFPIQSDTDFKLMMEVVKRGAKANFDKGARSCDDVHTSNVSRIQTAFAAQALRIIHLNVKSICGPQASKKASEKGEQSLHLNSTVSWSTSTSYRDYIKDVLQLVIRNPAVYPNSSLGAYAIEFASLSALTPVASQQFAVVCSLLDRVETGSATRARMSSFGSNEKPGRS